jgi:DME family drug/metabolite transporter
VVAVSGPLLGEWPTRRRLALIAVTVLGVWLTVLGASDVEPQFGPAGVGWGLLGAVTYASYTLYGRHATPRYGAVATAVYSTGAACVLLAIAVPMMSGPVVLPATPRSWLLLAVFGALTIAVAQFLFFDALGRAEASTVAVVSAAEPVVAALLATALLGQGLSAIGWLGIGLVVTGMAGVGMTPQARPAHG